MILKISPFVYLSISPVEARQKGQAAYICHYIQKNCSFLAFSLDFFFNAFVQD